MREFIRILQSYTVFGAIAGIGLVEVTTDGLHGLAFVLLLVGVNLDALELRRQEHPKRKRKEKPNLERVENLLRWYDHQTGYQWQSEQERKEYMTMRQIHEDSNAN